MRISNNIRTKLGQLHFLKEFQKVKHDREVVSFDEAKSIGILYDATNERNYEIMKNYVKQIRSKFKKDVLAMGFVDKKQLPPSQFAQYGLDFFSRKDLNFRMIPDNPFIRNFINEKFDILVNLNSGKCFPLRYISAMSMARFRVGPYDKKNMMCYDMMIQLNGETEMQTIIEETEKYLRQLKSKSA